MVYRLKNPIYGLKQASKAWNKKFHDTVQSFRFEQNGDEPCLYKRRNDNAITFLILYVDDILLIGNDVKVLSSVKIWLSSKFQMKDLGDASYILGIKLLRD